MRRRNKMPFQVSPGVNVSEIDLTTVVPAVSTTEGGIVGQFQWGPALQRVLVDSEDRLVNIFHKPDATTATSFFSAANFLAYGNQLYVVRGVSSDAYNATAGVKADRVIKNADDHENSYTSVSDDGDWVAKYPGALGNSLKVSVCPSANAWQQTIGVCSDNSYSFETTANVQFTFTAGSKVVAIGYSGNLDGDNSDATTKLIVGDSLLSSNNVFLGKIKSIDSATQITLDDNYKAFTDGGTSTLKVGSAPESAVDNARTTLVRRWEYYNNFDQAPTTTTYANTAGSTGDAIHIVVEDEDGLITGVRKSILETYESVSLATDAKTDQGASNYYRTVVDQQSAWVWTGHKNSNLNGAETATSATTIYGGGSGADQTTWNAPITVSLTNGADGTALGDSEKIAGYNLFNNTADVDVSFLLGSDANQTVATHLISNIAEVRKDCVVVLSPESADVVNNNAYDGKERDDVIAFRDTLPSSSYAVMDSGWKYQYDKYNDVYRYVPLNADTAGLMVQTDLTRDPWYSPAGFNRGNVKNAIKLAYNPSKADRDQLYKKGINPVVTFPGQGTVLFGDKTLLAQPSAFDRINVRRLFIVLEKAIATAANFTLFEFNDEFTRAQFKNLVEPFLRDVQGRRGITDFTVVVDGTNNTGEVIDRNEFVGDIYIKPARSINFIQLNFVAVRTGVEFSEIVGRAG
jgi:phage tail sheath protein FI